MIHFIRKKIHNSAILLTTLFASSLSFAGDFAVSPMMIDLQGVGRSSHQFAFNIFGKSDSDIKLELFDMGQLETGYMGFNASDLSNAENMANWVELSDTQFQVRDGETTTITGQINVPSKAAGTYLVGVMVEEDIPEEEQTGISVKIRYAVILNMRVEGSRNRRIKTEFDELVVVENDGELYVQGSFTNKSTIDDWLVSQVQFRDSDNRLFERVEMRTESAWQRGDKASRVFPGATVRLYGKISKSDKAGDYNVLVRNRFADKSQPVYRDTLRLEPLSKQESLTPSNISEVVAAEAVAVLPQVIPVEIKKNGTSFSSFYVANNSSSKVTIALPTAISDPEGKGIKDFQFYPADLALAPNQKSRVVLKQTHINEADYRDVEFLASFTSADGTTLEEQFLVKTVGAE
ncbi:MAG: hypothetical protein AB8B95_11215 [Pseudohongiellaceae bacterium]